MENKTPTGYVKWIAIAGGNTEKVLHIKLGEGDQYKPYWKRQMFWGRRDRISQQNPVGRTLRGFVLRWIGLGAIASSSLVFDRFFQLI